MYLADRCIAEIEDLHQFFTRWFSGAAPNADGTFARLGDVLAPDFHIVQPSGALLGREQIIEAVRSAHASDPEFSIRITDTDARDLDGGLCLVTYVEHQTRKSGQTKRRRSTALFRDTDDPAAGVQWLHVHETWIEEVPR